MASGNNMTRDDILTAIKSSTPGLEGMTDDDILFHVAKQYEDDGILDNYPVLKFELTKQRAALDVPERGYFGDVAAAVKRGWAGGMQGFNVLQGGKDPENAKDIADYEVMKAANPNSEETQQFLDAKSGGDSVMAFLKHPLQITSDIVAESLAGSIPSIVGNVGGAIVGGAVGAEVGGKVGGAKGALAGAALGAGAGSYITEYANGVLSSLQDAGMDLSNPESVQQFFSDPAKMVHAKIYAAKRAVPVAVFDAATAGLAGRFMKPVLLAKQAGKEVGKKAILGATAKELSTQAAGGMAGEASAQVVAGDDADGKAVFLEGLGEIGSAPLEVYSNLKEVREAGHAAARARAEANAAAKAKADAEAEAMASAAQLKTPLTADVPNTAPTYTEPDAKSVLGVPTITNESVAAKVLLKATLTPEEEAYATAHEDEIKALIVQEHTRVARDRAASLRGVDVGDQMSFPQSDMRVARGTVGSPVIRPIGASEEIDPTTIPERPGQPDLWSHQESVAAAQAKAAALQAKNAADRARLLEGTSGPGDQILLDNARMRQVLASQGKKPVIGPIDDTVDTPEVTTDHPNQALIPLGLTADKSGQFAIPGMEDLVPTEKSAEAMSPAPSPVLSLQPATADKTVEIGETRELPLGGAPLPPVVNTPPVLTKEQVKLPKAGEPLNDIRGHESATNIGAMVRMPSGELRIFPVVAGKDGSPSVVMDRKRELTADQIKEKVANYVGKSTSYVDRILYNTGILTSDGRIDEDILKREAKKPETRDLLRRVATEAIKLGFHKKDDVTIPLKQFIAENKGTTHIANVDVNDIVPTGGAVYQGELPQRIAKEFQPKSTAEDIDTIIAKSLKTPEMKAAYDRITVASAEDLAQIPHALDINDPMPAEQQMAIINRFSGGSKELTPAQKKQIVSTAYSARQKKIAAMKINAETTAAVAAPPSTPASVTISPAISPQISPAAQKAIDMAKLVQQAHETGDEKLLLKAGWTPEQIEILLSDEVYLEALAPALHDLDHTYLQEIFDRVKKGADVLKRVQSPEVKAARANVREFSNVEDYRAAGTTAYEAKKLVDTILYDMSRRGIRVILSEATKEMEAGGSYSPSKRTVALVFESIANPDRQSVLNALHEITHDILATAPEEIQRAFHDAIERTPNGELAFFRNPEADPRLSQGDGGLSPEELQIERGVEHLALQGIDREYSRGVLGAIFRAIKDLFLRAAIYLQKALVGEDRTTGRLAQMWMENNVGKVLAGDAHTFDTFLSMVGIEPKMADRYRVLHAPNDRVVAVKVNVNTGQVDYRPLYDLEHAPEEIEAAGASVIETAINDGTWTLDRDVAYLEDLLGFEIMDRKQPTTSFAQHNAAVYVQTIKSTAEAHIAVANALRPVFDRVLASVQKAQPNFTKSEISALKRAGLPVPKNVEDMQGLLKKLKIINLDERAKMANQRYEDLLEKQFGKVPDELKIDPAISMEKLSGAVSDYADLLAVKMLSRWRNTSSRYISRIREEISELEDKSELRRAKIAAVSANLADASVARAALNASISDHFRKLKRNITDLVNSTERYGEEAATLEALSEEKDRRALAEKFSDKLFAGIMFDEVPLHSILTEMHAVAKSSGLDVGVSPVTELRTAFFKAARADSSNPLNHLVELGEGPMAKDRGTALLSALISFVKNDRLTDEVIRVQMMKGEARAEAINAMRKVYGSANDVLLNQLADETRLLGTPTTDPNKIKTNPLTMRAAQQMLNERDEALVAQTRLSKLRQDLAIHETAKNVFDQLVNAAENRVEKGRDFVLAHGGHYLLASSPDMDAKMILAKGETNVLTLQGEKRMTFEELSAIIEKNQAWIERHRGDPNRNALVYHSLIKQNYEMKRLMVGDQVRDMIGGMRNGTLSGIGEVYLHTGTKHGERINNMINQRVGWERSARDRAEVIGKGYERARAEFQKLAKVSDYETFIDLFYDPARWWLDSGLPGYSEKEAFAFIDSVFRKDATTAKYWTQPGAAQAFFRLMGEVKKANALHNEWAEKSGAARVKDADLGNDERRRIDKGVSDYTTPRNMHQSVKDWADAFRSKSRGDHMHNVLADLKLKLSVDTMTANLAEKLRATFDESAWNNFLSPLLTHEQGGFPTPPRTDGVRTVILPTEMSSIVDSTGHDLFAVIDAVWKKYGKGDDEAFKNYQVEVLNWVRRRWDLLDNMTQAGNAAANGVTSIKVPSLGIDARAAALMPRQWLTYPEYSPEDNNRAAHAIFSTAAFGRDGTVLKTAIEQMQAELNAKKQEIAANGLPTKDLNSPEWQALKKTDRKKYDRLLAIAKYKHPDFVKLTAAVLDTERDLWTEFQNLREIFGAVTVGMVSGLKSAIKNPISILNLINMQQSAGMDVLPGVAGSYWKSGKLFFNALAQTIGVDFLKDNDYIAAQNRAGVFDSQNHTTFKDNITGERGINDGLGKFPRLVRILRTVFQNTKVGANGGSTPALRLTSPFQFTQLLVNTANTWQLMQTYHEMALRAADLYRQDPKMTRELTAKDVGMSSEVAFLNRKRFLMENGLTIEDLARGVAKGRDIMDDHFVMAVNNISTGVLANEASVLNRPVLLSRSKGAKMAGTFVGWGLDQTSKTFRLLESPEGRVTLRSFARGAGIMLLATLPLSLAYAALLDEWDELIEKKQNRMKVTSGPDAWTEALVSVGTTGLLGELVDGVRSYRQSGSGYSDAVSLDNRIVIVSSIRSMLQAARNTLHVGVGNANYANIGRPLFQAVGLGGLTQNAYVLDRVLGGALQKTPGPVGELMKAEASVALRSNMYNYLRVAGREVGLEVRSSGGGAYDMTPMTPHVSNMVLAALTNDRDEFQKSYRDAVRAAQKEGYVDPLKKVQQLYATRNPLRVLFNGTPLASEVAQMMNHMPPEGREAVMQGLRNYNSYGMALGLPISMGATELDDAQMRRQYQKNQNRTSALDRVRARAADFIRGD